MKKWKFDLPRTIAVVHLPPLLGSPGQMGQDPGRLMDQAIRIAVKEAKRLVQVGFKGIILENFGDVPFYSSHVPPETVAALSVIAYQVRRSIPFSVPLGINVLRNDALSAHAIALATEADFIRVNVLSGVVATDQGMIEGPAALLLREKVRLGSDIKILADIHVKHARSLSAHEDWVINFEEIMDRAGGDGVIVTGATTGRGPSESVLKLVSEAGKKTLAPWWLGSGLQVNQVSSILDLGGGFIVGSALRLKGQAGMPLDPKRLNLFRKALR